MDEKYLQNERYYGEKLTTPPEPYGLPRREIAWYPTVDPDKCDPSTCDYFCVDYCHMRVFEKRDGKAVVVDPYNCNVPSQSCVPRCPTGAISFPSKRELRDMLRAVEAKHKQAEP